MNLKIEYLDMKNQRTIVISDIHGNLTLFEKLLKKVSYDKNNDILIILGDFIEKGPHILETLKYVMELSKNKNVYILMGNCEVVPVYARTEKYLKKFFSYYYYTQNLIKEIYSKENFPFNNIADLLAHRIFIVDKYKEELDFLDNLTHILHNEDFIFVHAGLKSENLEEQKLADLLKFDGFHYTANKFERNVIVGHMPVSNYSKDKLSFNPIVDEYRKIISIDGGNIVNINGQVNAFIIENKKDFSFEYIDDLKIVYNENAQEESKNSSAITWLYNRIRIILTKGDFSLCEEISSKKRIWIKNDFIYNDNGVLRAYDYSDYFMNLKKHEQVSLVKKYDGFFLAKKNGTLTWVHGKALKQGECV